MNTTNDTKRLRILRKQLKGHYSKIAIVAGCATSTVSRVLNGDIYNLEILSTAITYRDALTRKKSEILEKI